jgi:hypothetical protein
MAVSASRLSNLWASLKDREPVIVVDIREQACARVADFLTLRDSE